MKKIMISVLLTISLLIAFSGTSFAVSAENDYSKIDGVLFAILEEVAFDEHIPVIIWFTDIDHSEPVSAALETATLKIENKTTVSSLAFASEFLSKEPLNDIETLVDATAFVETKRVLHEQAYQAANTKKLASVEASVGNLSAHEQDSLFISSYTPTIAMSLTRKQILAASKSAEVERIYYDVSTTNECDDMMDIASQVTGAAYVRDTKGYKGAGIKIGMIESGVPYVNSTLYNISNVHIDSESTAYRTSHSGRVSAILVGKQSGIAPEAELYCTSVRRTGGWRSGVEWLLSNGVNVINISNTLGSSTGEYGVDSRWMDHIAMQHDVHVVIASGNDGVGTVTTAAMGNNVICVGATDDKNTVTLSDDIIATFTSYVTSTYKPDLCAPGVNITVQHVNESNQMVTTTESGTSFAAPQVTASIALLCQENSTLKTRQDMAKSILISGTRQFETVSSSGSTNQIAMCYQFGSGVLSLKNSSYVNLAGRTRGTSFKTGETTYTYRFTVKSSDDFIRVSVAWLRNIRFSIDDHTGNDPGTATLANLKLVVTAPNGQQWVSSDTRGGVQVVAFVPPTTGTYTITITRTSGTGDKTYMGFSWY